MLKKNVYLPSLLYIHRKFVAEWKIDDFTIFSQPARDNHAVVFIDDGDDDFDMM